jgi:hypothetical protein
VEPSPRRNSTISYNRAGHSQRPATFPERDVLLNSLAGIVSEEIREDNVFRDKLQVEICSSEQTAQSPSAKACLQVKAQSSQPICEILTCNQ